MVKSVGEEMRISFIMLSFDNGYLWGRMVFDQDDIVDTCLCVVNKSKRTGIDIVGFLSNNGSKKPLPSALDNDLVFDRASELLLNFFEAKSQTMTVDWVI